MKREDIYTSLADVQEEILRRRNNKELDEKLNKFWGHNKPDFINEESPRLVLSKSLITPNREFEYFIDIAKEIDLDVCMFEYTIGKFVGLNQEKRHLGKLFFHHGIGKDHKKLVTSKNIVNFNTEEGKTINDVITLNDMSLSNFHHTLLKKMYPETVFNIHDISEWFNRTRYIDDYYVYYLALFLKDHVLFENFLYDEKEESKFTFDKFLPSFEKVVKLFGIKPLIVPLLPHNHEKSDFWFMYSEKVQKIVDDMV